jgi:hypothetical protein
VRDTAEIAPPPLLPPVRVRPTATRRHTSLSLPVPRVPLLWSTTRRGQNLTGDHRGRVQEETREPTRRKDDCGYYSDTAIPRRCCRDPVAMHGVRFRETPGDALRRRRSGSCATGFRKRHDHARFGARIVMPPADQDHGGRFYCCRDQEGNLWNFGSYDPWESK